jgi:hypothetical protein
MPSLLERSSGRERLRVVCALCFWAATYLLFVTWNHLQNEFPATIWQTRRLLTTFWGAVLFYGFTWLADRVADRSFRDRALILGAAVAGSGAAMILGRALIDQFVVSVLGDPPSDWTRHLRFTLIWGGYFAGGALAFLSFAPGMIVGERSASPAAAASPPPVANDASFPDALWVSRGRETVRVAVDAIQWVEAEGDYVRLHAATGGGLLRGTLTGLEGKLDPAIFARVHRSAICRRSAIVAMLRKPSGALAVRLDSGAEVPVGRRYRDSVAELLRPNEAQGRATA